LLCNCFQQKIKDDLSCEVELKTIDLIMLLVFSESGDKSALKLLEALFTDTKMMTNLFDKMLSNNKDVRYIWTLSQSNPCRIRFLSFYSNFCSFYRCFLNCSQP
jgi:hypothetical protein